VLGAEKGKPQWAVGEDSTDKEKGLRMLRNR